MRYTEIISAFYETQTKPIYFLWDQKVVFLNVKPGGLYSNYEATES